MEPSASPPASVRDATGDATLLAANGLRFVSAAYGLLQAEIALARRSLQALAIAAMLAPVLLVGLWFSALALLLIALQAAGLSWLAAAVLVCLIQVLLVSTLLRALRRWSRDLCLPRSRELVQRLMEPHA